MDAVKATPYCPKCGAPSPCGTHTPEHYAELEAKNAAKVAATRSMVREYENRAAYEADLPRMAEAGFDVATVTESTQGSGCLRFIMLGGIGALIFKPKPHLIVTYQRR